MKIGERGQITIPQKLRKRYGLQPPTEVEFVEESGRLILRKRAPKNYPTDESVGILAARKGDTDAIIEALRGR